MGWEYRGKNRYFYHCERYLGRVWKRYYGSGPEAELAAAAVESKRRARQEKRERLAGAKADLKLVDRQMGQLERAPLVFAAPITSDHSASERAAPPLPTPETALERARELLNARESGDPTAEAELTDLIDRFPSLMHQFGDVARLAHAKWLMLMVGKDAVFQAATIKKLNDLRSQFPVDNNPVLRLVVERIIATWLQLTYAEGKMAEAGTIDRAGFRFYSQLQQKAQRQHMQAIRTWNQMQNMPR